MSDLIDRQAAIDAFMKSTSDGDKADWCKWVLKQVPSAQPSQKNDSNTLDALDCVSRQAAIEAIHDAWMNGAYYTETINTLKQLPSAQPDKNMIHLQKEQAYMQGWVDGRETKMIAIPIKRREPVIRWIPCSERMPEIDETVLITIKEKYAGEKEYRYHTDVADYLINDDWMTFNDWDEGQEIEIVAWMPLPEPWKGEEK